MEDLQQVHAIFIGYEFSQLKKLEGANSGEELRQKVRDEYREEAEKCSAVIEETVLSYEELKNKRFLFFVLPFKNLDKLREDFSKEVKK